jgi:hypothetical protein
MYPSGYLVVSPSGQYTKHYYAGAERIASKVVGSAAIFQSAAHLSGEQTSTLLARQTNDLQAILTSEGYETSHGPTLHLAPTHARASLVKL